MKPVRSADVTVTVASRPSRGAWIETCAPFRPPRPGACRALHGARGLKLKAIAFVYEFRTVAPFTGRVD